MMTGTINLMYSSRDMLSFTRIIRASTTNRASILRAFTSGKVIFGIRSHDFTDMGVEIFDEFRYGKLHGENLQKYADKEKNDGGSC
ncbi:Diamine acetyltransferase 1 [Datura stramonium]|uniref:Diamine acetyltransferase 1 n=1 Tax=Datura stramonium TaxID=4076 RepID=A0ABS8TGP5_DATST|nr:Diamine acetyltransferase 1 [Datura stramonium]